MAKNQILTDYDDNGYPQYAASTEPLTGTAAVKAGPGRLHKVVVTTTTTGAITIYDNASAASGTILLAIPSGATAGTVYDVQLPADNGIYASFASGGAITVGYA